MEDRPMREKTEAEVFAELCALPARFRFEVERVTRTEPDPDALHAARPVGLTPLQHKEFEERMYREARPVTYWRVTLGLDPGQSGPSFYGHGPTLARAWGDVRGQIHSVAEIL